MTSTGTRCCKNQYKQQCCTKMKEYSCVQPRALPQIGCSLTHSLHCFYRWNINTFQKFMFSDHLYPSPKEGETTELRSPSTLLLVTSKEGYVFLTALIQQPSSGEKITPRSLNACLLLYNPSDEKAITQPVRTTPLKHHLILSCSNTQ